ncbi:ETNPPL [Bugula neritina]|uniref:ETNPPL n=1 Tax=Bugula neritina TaxID=10212 RepID=A0A7J7KJW6_BUGNE|nr:ETNPPL [Bugula neritina]
MSLILVALGVQGCRKTVKKLLHLYSVFTSTVVENGDTTHDVPSSDGNISESKKERLSTSEILDIRKTKYGPSCMLFFEQAPLRIERGSGQYMFDEEGTRYIDCINNVAHVGHSHPRVTEAAVKQMKQLYTNNRYLHDNLPRLVEKITQTMPTDLSVCYFTNSGSEANDLALQLTRMFRHRHDIITLDNAYHGTVTSLQQINPYKWKQVEKETSDMYRSQWVHVVPAPDSYRGKYRDDEYTMEELTDLYVQEVQHVVDDLRGQGRAPAALILESMQSCGGQIIYPLGYLKGIKRIMDECGGLIIADEVQVGFGRVGDHWWAFQQYGADFVPDIVTIGKPMGNGHPVAAVVTTKEISQSFKLPYFNTYGGNPVSCAIALAVLEVIETDGLMENAKIVGNYLMDQMRELASRHQCIGDVRGRGLFCGMDLVLDRTTREPATELAKYIVGKLRYDGVILSRDGPHENVLKFKPPMCFSKQDVDEVITKIDKLLYEF